MRTTTSERIEDFTRRGWWGERTILSLFDAAVAERPDQPALVDQANRADFADGDAERLSFTEVADAVANVSAVFHAHGLRKDDIVVVQLPNIVELPIVYLALARLGVVVSPVPVQYGKYELRKAQELVDAKAYITTSNFSGKDFATQNREAFPESCSLFVFGAAIPEGAIPVSIAGADSSELQNWQHYANDADVSANDVFTICWTSGTTGTPKGVPRSHNHWIAIATATAEASAVQDGERLLNPFPLVNMAGLSGFLFSWLLKRGTLVLHHPLALDVFLKQIEDEKIGYTIAPPAVLTMLLKRRELLDAIDLSSVRAIGSGAAPLSPWMVMTFQEDYGIEIINLFGSNEGMCLASNARDVPDPADRAQYFPRYGIEGFEWSTEATRVIRTRLVDLQSGEIVNKPGIQGELEIWGATVFDGYFKSPEANEEVFTEDGWFRTGDVFEIAGEGDKEKLYKFVGRCKDIIVRGGMNISPDEIDNLLAGHPKVAEAAVVGYDDEVMGEKVGAVVVPKPGETVSLDDITDFLREKGLAVFKLPEKLRCVDELPHNATGKVLRRELKALFDEEQ